MGKRVILFGIGAGPFHFKAGNRMLIRMLELMHRVYVRDNGSMAVIRQQLKYRGEIFLVPDPAFVGSPSPGDHGSGGQPDAVKTIALSVMPIHHPIFFSKGGSLKKYRRFIDDFSKEVGELIGTFPDFRWVLMSSDTDDHFAIRDLQQKIPAHRNKTQVKFLEDIDQTTGFISFLDGIMGFRLHSLVIAQSLSVPAFGIIGQEKLKYYFDNYSIPDSYFRMGEGAGGWTPFQSMAVQFLTELEDRKKNLIEINKQTRSAYFKILNSLFSSTAPFPLSIR